MISKIYGIIDDIGDGYFTLMTSGGVGYNIFSTTNTISILQSGEQITIYVETQVREDSIRLFGFVNFIEKIWFNLLCTVQGVGAKVALSILSSLSTDQLYNAISFDDKDLISTANGVGPKMASRIVSELKSKINSLPKNMQIKNGNDTDYSKSDGNKNNKISAIKIDAVTALVNLGYKKMEAISAVSQIIADKIKNNPDISINLSDLIKDSLKTFEIK